MRKTKKYAFTLNQNALDRLYAFACDYVENNEVEDADAWFNGLINDLEDRATAYYNSPYKTEAMFCLGCRFTIADFDRS